ncbi:MAG TPA: ABC transporter permease [Candidatus Cloacimonetes bacterium]|nr:ABC transporter permease [Candidatus Cloacimonadota bacterium]HEX37963.1 ABC transporter permease [Candidatus Cloacimonadota bacterium]
MIRILSYPISSIGRVIIYLVRDIGRYFIFLGLSIRYITHIGRRIGLIFNQMQKVGVESLPLIAVTSAFTGMVTAVQATYQTGGILPYRYLGAMITKSTMIELAPVLTALVMAGKIGASLAAELGTMRVTDQIDALEVLAINPYDYLIIPRIIAGVIMLPILVVFANVFGILSGYVVSTSLYHVTTMEFLVGIRMFFVPVDFWSGIVKAIFFGLIISSIGCYQGFFAKGGAEGVGKVTTRAVVISSILILVTDFIVAAMIFG